MNKACTIEDFLAGLTENLSAEEILAADTISDISNAIVKQRMSMGLNQRELAEKIGKSQSTISKWENGDMNFTIELLSEIAVKLNMKLSVKLESMPMVERKGEFRTVKSRTTPSYREKTFITSEGYRPPMAASGR